MPDVAAESPFTFLFFDLVTLALLEELPVQGSRFACTLDGSGQMGGTVPLFDTRVRNMDPIGATHPGRTALFVDFGGTIIWGGQILTRQYNRKAGAIQLGGAEFPSWWRQRVQAKDYSTTWSAASDPMTIAQTVITDAQATSSGKILNGGFTIVLNGTTPVGNYITASYPNTQLNTLDNIIGQLTAMGYGTGFDYTVTHAWSGARGSTPVVTLTFWTPRAGRVAAQTGLVIDTADVIDWNYNEDASSSAVTFYETASGSGGIQAAVSAPQPISTGYPLTEKVVSRTQLTSSSQLIAAATGDLAAFAWPVVTGDVTMDINADPQIGTYLIGDDFHLSVPKVAGNGLNPDPRFPSGMDYFFRIIQYEVSPPTAGGIPQVKITFAAPPSQIPVQPPLV